MTDFRERLLTALNHQEPDRVPVMGLIMDPATVNQILGREPVDLVSMLEDSALRDSIIQTMNDDTNWNRTYYHNFCGALESAIKLGFDANWTIYSYMELAEDPSSKLGLSWHDVFGRIWEMTSDTKGNMILNYARPLCPTEEEWYKWVERKEPKYKRVINYASEFHQKLVQEYGDSIIPVGYAAPGIFENSWQPIGFVNFTKYIFQKPEFAGKVIDFYTDFYLKYLEAIMIPDINVVLAGDDLSQKTGPMLRPDMIDRLLGDSYRRVAETVHAHGKKLIFHSCGNIYPLLDRFIDWGFDGLITMEPTAGMELGEVRKRVGHKLVLIGNLDVSYLLVNGTRKEVEAAVKKAINDTGSGGGYILSASHSHPSVDGERLKWMVHAAHKYGKYPLQV